MSYLEARAATLFLQSLGFLKKRWTGGHANPYNLALYPRAGEYLEHLCGRTYSSYRQFAYPHPDGQNGKVEKRKSKRSFKPLGVSEVLFKPYSTCDDDDTLDNFLPSDVFFVWDFELEYAQKCLNIVNLPKDTCEDVK
jgi:hypothetical protein